MQMRERDGVPDEGTTRATINAQAAEIAQLKARLGDVPPTLEPNPPRSNVVPDIDIVPPSEIADRDPGPRPGPDDKPPPTVIDADAVDIRQGFGNVDEPWRRFCTDVEGNPLTVRGRRY
jgi:hypothetical protein